MDVVPGHYNSMWFRPTKAGRYHFFCSQYCGTSHAIMGGWVTVMEPDEYAAWLAGASATGDPVALGAKLYNDLACGTCHLPDGKGRGPSYNGAYGSKVKLADGSRSSPMTRTFANPSFSRTQKLLLGFSR